MEDDLYIILDVPRLQMLVHPNGPGIKGGAEYMIVSALDALDAGDADIKGGLRENMIGEIFHVFKLP